MKDLIIFIVKQLVDNPDDVVVISVPTDEGETISINVNSADTGKIIGKQGRIAMSIRTIAKAMSSKNGIRYKIEIVDSL